MIEETSSTCPIFFATFLEANPEKLRQESNPRRPILKPRQRPLGEEHRATICRKNLGYQLAANSKQKVNFTRLKKQFSSEPKLFVQLIFKLLFFKQALN